MRDALAADLAAVGVPVFGDWPVDARAPCVFIAPPLTGYYVSGARELGTYVLSVDVVVLVEKRPPNEGRDDLETLLEGVLANTVDWALVGVDPPSGVTVSDSTIQFLGTVVHLSKAFRL